MLDRAKKTGNGALLSGYDTIRIDGVYSDMLMQGQARSFFKLNNEKMCLMKAVVKYKKTDAQQSFNDIKHDAGLCGIHK